ncbi:MAG: GTPase [Desulfomonilaceae bacterium]|nr:GTPase [Desulfomonilaceae bacterium]
MPTVSEIRSLRFDPRMTDFRLLQGLCTEADRLVEAYRWKVGLGPGSPLIACLIGGTGTGKSTLFNSLAGKKISEVGMRRPCTLKAVLLVHEQFVQGIQGSPYLDDGTRNSVTVVSHQRLDLSPLVLVDTPDFDSVEAANRQIFESFFVVSDLVIYVTSQEKYADRDGWEKLVRAIQWGKKTICVMNKVTSDVAYRDFEVNVLKLDRTIRPVRVEKVDHATECIPGLRDRAPFSDLFGHEVQDSTAAQTRTRELEALRTHAAGTLERLEETIGKHAERTASVNVKIERILSDITREMEKGLDAVVTQDIEIQIRDRLKTLLRKYDILFVPRMMVRNTILRVFHSVADMVGLGNGPQTPEDRGRQIRAEDLRAARSAAKLEPLQTAVAKLNLQIAQILSTDPGLDDFRRVARDDVVRWEPGKVQALYDEAFPGVEHLLEAEFNRFREGLSRTDEMKLYGSYTVWALFLITAEIIVGGGFTLFDAMLNTVIVPFIPKWLLNVKVVDLLREIGERVDRAHRDALHGILTSQADLYRTSFSNMVPTGEQTDRLRRLRLDMTRRNQ